MVRVSIEETELGFEVRLLWGNNRVFAASGYFDEANEPQGFYDTRGEAAEAIERWFGSEKREMPLGVEIEDSSKLKKELEWHRRQR